jgi:hypothetical protein
MVLYVKLISQYQQNKIASYFESAAVIVSNLKRWTDTHLVTQTGHMETQE